MNSSTTDPIQPTQLLHNRYLILQKLGWGQYSTVWLAHDQTTHTHKAIKILSPECYNTSHPLFELEIMNHLRITNPLHPGYQHISILLDDFIHTSPLGTHVCLVLELMADDLKGFALFFPGAKIPNPIMKRITRQILLALEYIHDCGVIHTDIKQDNIMIKLRNPNTTIKQYQADTSGLSLGEYNFDDPSEFTDVHVTLCDFGSASWVNNHLTSIIQPVLLRAPEVILQASWGVEVDIWNLGALLPELLDAVRMFDGRADVTGGEYHVKHHVEEIEALFGPFPGRLLGDADQGIVRGLFDQRGRVRDPIERRTVDLGMWIEGLDGGEKEGFLDLLRKMLVIEPGRRMGARELQGVSWLRS